jgi:hypothetical protein
MFRHGVGGADTIFYALDWGKWGSLWPHYFIGQNKNNNEAHKTSNEMDGPDNILKVLCAGVIRRDGVAPVVPHVDTQSHQIRSGLFLLSGGSERIWRSVVGKRRGSRKFFDGA